MIHRRRLAVTLLALVGLGSVLSCHAQVEPRDAASPGATSERAAAERRLASVRTLIENSSAAVEIEKSAKPEALARRNTARQTVRLAVVALDGGDLKAASHLLEDAAREMIAAARLARGERSREDGEQREIALRMESARALLAAQRRIGTEKPGVGAADIASRIEKLLDEAQAHLAARRFGQARPLVDEAYLVAKAAVSAMRGGDTLVRSLNFVTKEEEYHYEVDRNDTHRMLLTLLVQQRGADVGGAVARAQSLRREAETRASRGDFTDAIRLLEDSTRELVRAIRGAGVFIPG